jgi:hypothetical protein
MHTARPTTRFTARLLARIGRRPTPDRSGRSGLRRPRPLLATAPLPPGAAVHADLAAMGAAIATAGPSASHALLAHVADHARVRGVASSAVGLLDDPAVPDVVRTRAFAVVATRLGEASPAAASRSAA